MTEKKTNRFTDFTFGQNDDRDVRWKKTKNGFHNHGQIIAICARIKHLTTSNEQTTFCLTRLINTHDLVNIIIL